MAYIKIDQKFLELIQEKFQRDLLDEVIEFVDQNLDPEDVFNEKKLQEWAESNGYIKPE